MVKTACLYLSLFLISSGASFSPFRAPMRFSGPMEGKIKFESYDALYFWNRIEIVFPVVKTACLYLSWFGLWRGGLYKCYTL